ncbi:YajG family lipoprotein [Photobacterium sp. 1_MG-2023]|uniref:YajG family lipoprotein n=1 Tax=Photobacterium sp. 1_MG-2023 TaxID=3062646 RepID=UPI0026E17399|nr:YajG family lipoprotein [Photobacterium sp. 1_MG-2023]MDO6705272.1 YajG family lipoprotein [Photobacterium sp. 1_MG-2023]
MRPLLLALSMLALTACTAPTDMQLSLQPTPALSSQASMQGLNLNLESRDLRTAQFVAVIDNGDKNVHPLHATENLRLTLQNALTRQLESQGVQVGPESQSTMRMDILEAIVNVKQSAFSHTLNSKLQLQLVLTTPNGKFIKRYAGKSSREGAMNASPEAMELAMNGLMDAVLRDIQGDAELSSYMEENL